MDPRGDSRVDPQTTLTMLWRNSLSITGLTHEKLTSICFFTITNGQIVRSRSLPHRVKLQIHESDRFLTINISQCQHARNSAVIVKTMSHVLIWYGKRAYSPEIMTVIVIGLSDVKWYRFLRFHFSVFSLFSVSIEKIYQTLKTVFHQITKHPKLVKNTLFSTLLLVFGNVYMDHAISCLIYYFIVLDHRNDVIECLNLNLKRSEWFH